MSRAAPSAAYDPVATLYDRAFSDIRARRLEWRWLTQQLQALGPRPRVLEIGCGTGALLRALAPRIGTGIGLDVSEAMLERARANAAEAPQLSFRAVQGPTLQIASGSVDVVISFLSFRYLDWEPIWPEIVRVLAPGGCFLMVDLVRAPAAIQDVPKLLRSGLRRLASPIRTPGFTRALRDLVRHPGWAEMLAQHPMRPLGAYQSFFAARVHGARLQTLDVAPGRRIVALNSGALA